MELFIFEQLVGHLREYSHAASNHMVLWWPVFFLTDKYFVGTNDGLYVSSNGGTTFAKDLSAGIPRAKRCFHCRCETGSTTRFFIITAFIRHFMLACVDLITGPSPPF